MRDDKTIIKLITGLAESRDEIRYVVVNGSRVNPNVKGDLLQDYDVCFGVADNSFFLKDKSWMSYFGDLAIYQHNVINSGSETEFHIFLMQFKDLVRIDLSIKDCKNWESEKEDSLTVVLLDKDNKLEGLPPPGDSGYLTKKPAEAEFDEIINEYWWCKTNVIKGLFRKELPYVKYMYETIVRNCMTQIMKWYIAAENNWNINSGYCGKWIERQLPKRLWEKIKRTYTGNDYGEIWKALIEGGALIRELGLKVASELNFTYPIDDDQNVMEYLAKVRKLSEVN